MKIKINLPTKITISRIILAFGLLVSIFVMYLVDQFNPFIMNANFALGEAKEVMGIVNWAKTPHMNWIMLILFGIFLIASLTDFLDGYLARKNNEVTDLGKFLDPIADKMLVNGMMVFLCLNFNSIRETHLSFPFFCVILMIIRDLVVDGLRLMAAKKNVVIAANMFGKVKTVLQMTAICLVFLNGFPFNFFDYNFPEYAHITDIICYLATIVSLLSGFIYLKQNKLVFGGENNE